MAPTCCCRLYMIKYHETSTGGGEFRGENFAVKKSGENFPLSTFLQRVTGEYCEFRHAQRCTKQREGTRDVFVCNMQWLCPECRVAPGFEKKIAIGRYQENVTFCFAVA